MKTVNKHRKFRFNKWFNTCGSDTMFISESR